MEIDRLSDILLIVYLGERKNIITNANKSNHINQTFIKISISTTITKKNSYYIYKIITLFKINFKYLLLLNIQKMFK